MVEAGWTEVLVKIVDWPEDKQREFIIKDNVASGDWDYDVLANEWDIELLNDWGLEVDWPDIDEKYSNKITTPTYEPSDYKPDIEEIYDTTKMDDLISKIQQADISEEIKKFLIVAAHRHAQINYSLVADYYSHSSKEIQELFEDSALVIIDFDKAIENGYVQMNEQIAQEYSGDYEQ